ncbi:hypothetical protein [Luteolibacter sp. LG18]|uniref:hypothetical protein n=1 Tax=Luteolibacter sp. LG18 TaxID=2819286 RepID=UPI0030C740D0
MSKISSGNLPKVLELRKKNGLEATEEAANADLEASKAKWTEEDTPRYRRAGESPIFISGKYLTKAGVDPSTGERDAGRVGAAPVGAKKAPKAPAKGGEVNEKDFYLALHKKGFKVAILRNEITGELTSEIPAAIKALDLQFGGVPGKNEDSVHVTQTGPQVLLTLTLDKFLELAKIKP